ncbi:MAG: T9SS type A sorting domain-containing protein, partial [Candidatus Eisenbacteria bacterium]|nr:T9SS type A sorting domain-containing protein [Candidatus Eisenbacteria bacterium]
VYVDESDELIVTPNTPARPLAGIVADGRPVPVPPVGAGLGSRSTTPTVAWSIGIRARCQDALDCDNLAAVRAEASVGSDRFDLPEPPPIGEFVSVFFPHPEWGRRATRFCTDVRAPIEGAEWIEWTLAVESNVADRIALSFDLTELDPDQSAQVMDQLNGVAWDLRTDASFELGPIGTEPRELSLFVGAPAGVQNALDDARAGLAWSHGTAVYPNPFSSATTVFYELPRPLAVTLEIFGIDGRRVRLLREGRFETAGRHAVVWDGLEDAGAPVAQGTYFYRLTGKADGAQPFRVSGRLTRIE